MGKMFFSQGSISLIFVCSLHKNTINCSFLHPSLTCVLAPPTPQTYTPSQKSKSVLKFILKYCLALSYLLSTFMAGNHHNYYMFCSQGTWWEGPGDMLCHFVDPWSTLKESQVSRLSFRGPLNTNECSVPLHPKPRSETLIKLNVS